MISMNIYSPYKHLYSHDLCFISFLVWEYALLANSLLSGHVHAGSIKEDTTFIKKGRILHDSRCKMGRCWRP